MKYFEDVAVGDVSEIGSFTFTQEAIKRFATAYDPQPFHIDDEAAARSLYGGLIASGWHVASIWMKLMVAHQKNEMARARHQGGVAAQLGPSPGFRDMVWAKPVRPGDTLHYRVEVSGRKETASRPQWGLVFMRSYADNQHRERVFQFDGVVFWEKRGGA